MPRRTQDQWRELFDAHQSSGLSAAAFCREHNIDPKYFCLRKRQILAKPSAFVKAEIVNNASAAITIQHKQVEIRVSHDSAAWCAQLINALH